LWTPTEAQKAEVRHKNAQADKAEAEARAVDLDTGAVTNAELRQHLQSEGRYGLTDA
tara:strand:- start:2110 stop:2280 length:171 start_codon:yes stop_codon:yes gene_type:complete